METFWLNQILKDVEGCVVIKKANEKIDQKEL